jgi:23S rRNA pseudouridine2605 synthase
MQPMSENTSPPKSGSSKKPAAAKSGGLSAKADVTPEGDRIAKVLSRAGVASRREAERMIELGEVAVNGKVITSPALNVTARDKITVRGEAIGEPEQARLWLYYKPEGLVTSEADEKGRETVFDNLPAELPRVMSVGRLDLNSEGLLLLTNDGALKRRLELPSTGWLRKYRVRVNGNPMDPDLEPLRKGIVVDGEKFQPMIVVIDRIQGANAWLTVGLREGKNREIRRAMAAINLTVNRLIRISYGPFRLGELKPGEVEEVKGKVLRDQLGEGRTPDDEPKRSRAPRSGASRTTTGKAEGASAARRPSLADASKSLSKSYSEATKPRSFGTVAKKIEGTKTPVRPARPGKPAPGGKPRRGP